MLARLEAVARPSYDLLVEGTECRNPGSALGDDAVRQSVREVMLTAPKTLPAEATVGDLRRLFTNPRVESALLVDGSRFFGVVDRERLYEALPDDVPAAPLSQHDDVTIEVEATIADALARMDESGGRRLVVVGDDGGTVQGLLCLNSGRTGFCR